MFKMRRSHLYDNTGQSLLEYVMLVIAVAAALTLMTVYVQRSIQANLKTVEDQVNVSPVKN